MWEVRRAAGRDFLARTRKQRMGEGWVLIILAPEGPGRAPRQQERSKSTCGVAFGNPKLSLAWALAPRAANHSAAPPCFYLLCPPRLASPPEVSR